MTDNVETNKDAALKSLEASQTLVMDLLQEVLDHQDASFYGPDAEKNRRAQWRGIVRKIKKVLKGASK